MLTSESERERKGRAKTKVFVFIEWPNGNWMECERDMHKNLWRNIIKMTRKKKNKCCNDIGRKGKGK